MKTIALIGPSGTGKSHRALLIENYYNIDLIIDDGLLIKGTQIIAGISSKSQNTKIGAIKTALFSDENHCNIVKEAIRKEKPHRILIIGTSNGMVKKITQKLELPLPEKIIQITDIASKEEINKATSIRKKYNKHVIPAPTVEVKPRVSGILSTPLQTIFNKENKKPVSSNFEVEQTVVKPTFSYLGNFYISNAVLNEVTKYIVNKFPEVYKFLKAHIKTTSHGIEINIEITVYYDKKYNLIQLGNNIQKDVKKYIEDMTALHIKKVSVEFKKMVCH